jgi:hypothetical protein
MRLLPSALWESNRLDGCCCIKLERCLSTAGDYRTVCPLPCCCLLFIRLECCLSAAGGYQTVLPFLGCCANRWPAVVAYRALLLSWYLTVTGGQRNGVLPHSCDNRYARCNVLVQSSVLLFRSVSTTVATSVRDSLMVSSSCCFQLLFWLKGST